MGPGGSRERKRALRASVRAERDALPSEDRARASEEIVRALLSLPQVVNARSVMAFSSFGSEVDTSSLLEHLSSDDVRVILPRVEGSAIAAVAYDPGDPVRRAAFGGLEPSDGEIVPPEEIDVVIVPGLAFDRSGHRVGYGGGFYDRFVLSLRPDAVTIGVAFSQQIVDAVPHGSKDRPVDLIVTEHEIIHTTDPT